MCKCQETQQRAPEAPQAVNLNPSDFVPRAEDGWIHWRGPVDPTAQDAILAGGGYRSGYREHNRAPRGSACGDGWDTLGFWIPQKWEEDAKNPEWSNVLSWHEQPLEANEGVALVIPQIKKDGVWILIERGAVDVCDWPDVIAVLIEKPAPPAAAPG